MHSVAADAWAFGWEALVAIGTILLAAGTAWLAWNTRNLAQETADEVQHSAKLLEATQEQARIANEALEASNEQTALAQQTLAAQIRPVLIDVPVKIAHGDDQAERINLGEAGPYARDPGAVIATVDSATRVIVSVPIRNAGAGLAMITGIGLRLGKPFPPPVTLIQPANLPAGEGGRASFIFNPDHPAHSLALDTVERGGVLDLEISYTDLAGQQPALVQYSLHLTSSHEWVVRQVLHIERETGAPFAGSAPVA